MISTAEYHSFESMSDMSNIAHIFIRMMTVKTLVYPLTPEQKISEIKEWIFKMEQIPVEKQKIVFQGKELSESQTLDLCGVTDKSIIHICDEATLKLYDMIDEKYFDIVPTLRCRTKQIIRQGTQFYKVFDKSLCHHGYQYESGVTNYLKQKFNPELEHGGGFYICDLSSIHKWFYLYPDGLIYMIMIPEDALVCVTKDYMLKVSALRIGCNGMDISKFVKTQNLEEQVLDDEYNLRHIDRQTPQMWEKACDYNPMNLNYVREQSPGLCKKYLSKDGLLLRFVKKQTVDLCEIAVRQNGLALAYVKKQTAHLCEIAIAQNACASQYVKLIILKQ
jgi:hypothetical protein